MKIKKNLKRFFSMNRQNGGFTLVELIVVIAILAILAGIGIPAYSGYITKANKQADITLISDVKKALELQYYATGGDIGRAYVVVTQDDAFVAENDTFAQEAMDKAFGAGWENAVRIKSDDWANAARMLNQVKNNPNLAGLNDSSYIKNVGTDKLMSDMQQCVSSLADFLEANSKGAEVLDDNMGGGTYVQDYIKDYKNPNADVLANAAVMGLANAANANKAEIQQKFANGVYILQNYQYGSNFGVAKKELNINDPNLLMDAANTYASLEAFVGYLDNDAVTAKFNEKLDFSAANNNTALIVKNISKACDEIMTIVAQDGELMTAAQKYLTDGTAGKDAKAYLGIMQTVNNLDDDYKKQMDNGSLFVDGTIANDVDDLIAAVSLYDALQADPKLAAIAGNLEGSAIIVVLNNENGAPECDALPTEVELWN